MSVYHFVGSECELGGTKLNRLGQQVTLADDVAKHAVLGGSQLLPADRFEQVGFTEQELSLYPYPGQQTTAPEVFKTKLKAAWVAVAEYKNELEAQGAR
jgi:hypothetical protein